MIPFVIGMFVLNSLFGNALSNALNLLGGDGTTDIGSVPGTIGLIICGFVPLGILVLAPPVYLYARWLAAPAALLAEGTGPMDSLRRSWRLSEGNVRRIVGYVILLGLLVIILPALIEDALEWIIEIILPTNTFELMMGWSSAFSSFFLIIGTPFYIAAVVLLYYDLRIRPGELRPGVARRRSGGSGDAKR